MVVVTAGPGAQFQKVRAEQGFGIQQRQSRAQTLRGNTAVGGGLNQHADGLSLAEGYLYPHPGAQGLTGAMRWW